MYTVDINQRIKETEIELEECYRAIEEVFNWFKSNDYTYVEKQYIEWWGDNKNASYVFTPFIFYKPSGVEINRNPAGVDDKTTVRVFMETGWLWPNTDDRNGGKNMKNIAFGEYFGRFIFGEYVYYSNWEGIGLIRGNHESSRRYFYLTNKDKTKKIDYHLAEIHKIVEDIGNKYRVPSEILKDLRILKDQRNKLYSNKQFYKNNFNYSYRDSIISRIEYLEKQLDKSIAAVEKFQNFIKSKNINGAYIYHNKGRDGIKRISNGINFADPRTSDNYKKFVYFEHTDKVYYVWTNNQQNGEYNNHPLYVHAVVYADFNTGYFRFISYEECRNDDYSKGWAFGCHYLADFKLDNNVVDISSEFNELSVHIAPFKLQRDIDFLKNKIVY